MRHNFDVLIIGTGIAGLSAAIYLKDAGLNIAVITKVDEINETNTNYAQGGIIAWKEGDSCSDLENDILKAGCRYNNVSAVKLFAEQGPQLVFDFFIKKLKTPFTQTSEGKLDYTEEAAHSDRRVLHFEDHTGDVIQNSLKEYCAQLQIPITPLEPKARDVSSGEKSSVQTSSSSQSATCFGGPVG